MNKLVLLGVLLVAMATASEAAFKSDASKLLFKSFKSLRNGVAKMHQVEALAGEHKSVSSGKKPSFCRSLACPTYTVVMKTKDYEERRYGSVNWVTTKANGTSLDSVQYTLFMRLFQYIQGNNVQSRKISMTVPVKMKITPGEGPACVSFFEMSFFLPKSVGKAPKPKDPEVYLTTSKPLTVYVKSFPGFAKEADWPKQVKSLSEALAGKGFAKNYYYTAGYDSPFTFFRRHNEVWIAKV